MKSCGPEPTGRYNNGVEQIWDVPVIIQIEDLAMVALSTVGGEVS